MPTTKIYDIVTNDIYELPVKYDRRGAKAVGEYLGMSENNVRKYLFINRWQGRYKAIVAGIAKPVWNAKGGLKK